MYTQTNTIILKNNNYPMAGFNVKNPKNVKIIKRTQETALIGKHFNHLKTGCFSFSFTITKLYRTILL